MLQRKWKRYCHSTSQTNEVVLKLSLDVDNMQLHFHTRLGESYFPIAGLVDFDLEQFAIACLLGRTEQPFRTGLCFTRDVSFLWFRHSFSELPRPIALKLCQMVGIRCNFITPLQKFGGLSPQKIWGQKHAKFRSILYNRRL